MRNQPKVAFVRYKGENPACGAMGQQIGVTSDVVVGALQSIYTTSSISGSLTSRKLWGTTGTVAANRVGTYFVGSIQTADGSAVAPAPVSSQNPPFGQTVGGSRVYISSCFEVISDDSQQADSRSNSGCSTDSAYTGNFFNTATTAATAIAAYMCSPQGKGGSGPGG